MKAKKILAILLAMMIALSCVISVSAAELELTDEVPGGESEVTARIEGGNPGDVSYVITIPDVVDFGVLHQPDVQEDDYVYADYTVTAKTINNLDPATQQVSVYVRDKNATTIDGDNRFWIANKSDPDIKFEYDVFDVPENSITATTPAVNQNNFAGTVGYFLEGFTEQDQAVNGTLRLNQVQLYGRDILELVGDYSGYMVFFSMVEGN